MFNLFYGDKDYYSNLNKNTIEFSLDFTTVWFVILGFENPNFIFIIRYIRLYQNGSTSGSMTNSEENRGVVYDNHFHDGD
jgi:hypothetical protein